MNSVSKYAFVFLLTILILPLSASAQTGFSVRADIDDFLYSIELETGVSDQIGSSGFNDVECLAYNLSGDTLYGVNDAPEDGPPQLITCFDVHTSKAVIVLSIQKYA